MKNGGETAHAEALMQENLADFKLTCLAGIRNQAEWDRGGGEKGKGREVDVYFHFGKPGGENEERQGATNQGSQCHLLTCHVTQTR